MSVQLNPPNSLGFRRPLTTLVKRSLTITNNNTQPVAFKVKTTAPKLYCVRPNSGRVEPGESIDVSVMLQALKEEPPLSTKCKDKFLIQSTIITPDKETLPLSDIWSSSDANEEGKVFQQKLRVTYLPAEGQVVEEEDENNQAGMMSMMSDSEPPNFETVRQRRAINGHPTIGSHLLAETEPHSEFSAGEDEVARQESQDSTATAALAQVSIPAIVEPAPAEPEHRPPTPVTQTLAAAVPVPAAEEVIEEQKPAEVTESRSETAPTYTEPAPIVPVPQPLVITRENPVNEELYAKYNEAMSEVDRLQAFIASLQQQLKSAEETATAAAVAAPPPPPTSELRRRTRRLSDDSAAPSEAVTMVEEVQIHSDGVPLNVVVVIALVVFVTTYLFF